MSDAELVGVPDLKTQLEQRIITPEQMGPDEMVELLRLYGNIWDVEESLLKHLKTGALSPGDYETPSIVIEDTEPIYDEEGGLWIVRYRLPIDLVRSAEGDVYTIALFNRVRTVRNGLRISSLESVEVEDDQVVLVVHYGVFEPRQFTIAEEKREKEGKEFKISSNLVLLSGFAEEDRQSIQVTTEELTEVAGKEDRLDVYEVRLFGLDEWAVVGGRFPDGSYCGTVVNPGYYWNAVRLPADLEDVRLITCRCEGRYVVRGYGTTSMDLTKDIGYGTRV